MFRYFELFWNGFYIVLYILVFYILLVFGGTIIKNILRPAETPIPIETICPESDSLKVELQILHDSLTVMQLSRVQLMNSLIITRAYLEEVRIDP